MTSAQDAARKLLAKLGLSHLDASVLVIESDAGIRLLLMVDKSRLAAVAKRCPASLDGHPVEVRRRPKIKAHAA